MAAELISFSTGLDWIKKLWDILWKRREKEKYRKEIEEIKNAILHDPIDIAQYYIEPECQDINPADYLEEDYPIIKEPVMKRIDQFFQFKPAQLGGNQMFILSDAGMGKTSLLIMLKLMHLNSLCSWSKDKVCVLKKLGKTTLDEIAKIENKRDTILLLDSLDEDTAAFGRVRERLADILRITQHFHKTIVICRTQFLPNNSDNSFKRSDLIIIDEFKCPCKYLSFFSDNKVLEYLTKRFHRKSFILSDNSKIEEAQVVISKMGTLRCRPMLLAYIEDLMEMPNLQEENSEYLIYDKLIRSWLKREQSKSTLSDKDINKACIILALFMQIHNSQSISERNLDKLIKKFEPVLSIKKMHIEGRSLINRDSYQNYRFSHYTIQEFLIAKLLLDPPELPGFKLWHKIRMTDFIVKMIAISKKQPDFIEQLDFREMNLSGINLRGIQLAGANLSGTDLSKTDLRNANLRGAAIGNTKFHHAILERCLFESEFSFREKLGLIFVYIPPGEFMMGSPEGEPGRFNDETLHKVTLTKGFYMQITPVTQQQYKMIMGTNPSEHRECGRNCPVENITWDEAWEFIERLNKDESTNSYRLPTEAEWEYACRAGTNTAFFGSRILLTDKFFFL